MNPHKHTANGSIRTTLFVETSTLLALAVAVTVTAAFFFTRNEMQTRAAVQLQSIIHAKEELLESVTSSQREQVAQLARDSELAQVPTVTNIIGFQGLFIIAPDGTVKTLVGAKPSDAETAAAAKGEPKSTHFVAMLSRQRGWESYVIAAPMRTGGRLAATFNAEPLLGELLSVDELGATTDILLGAKTDGDLLLLHQARGSRSASPLDLGPYEVRLAQGSALAKAIGGQEGIGETADYAGIGVLASYRALPSIGWGIVVQIDRHEIDLPLAVFALKLLTAGAVLIVLLSLVMFSLSRRITEPLLNLARKLDGLEARNWRFSRSIYTGNEIERLDAAAFELTGRLRQSHDSLEGLVRVRTKALMEQLAQDDAILHSIEYGLIVTDADGNVALLNGAAALLTGWKHDEAAGKPCEDILAIVDHDGKPVTGSAHPVTGVLADKTSYAPAREPQWSLKRRDGTLMPLALRVTPILRGWHCSGSVAIFRDTTEDRRIDRMKSEFISLVSHQLRTPLSSMRWYLEMLGSNDTGPLTEDQQSYVDQVAESTERMVRLVNALLNVSRIELGTLSAGQDSVDPAAVLKEIVGTVAKDAEKRKLTFAVDASGYAQGPVKTDAVLFRLILENLVLNAVKYGNEGSIVNISIGGNAGTCMVSVKDIGIGIPPEEQHKVFSKLFRAKNAQASDTDGNGLGLYISRVAAESIAGTLSFTSEAGVTVFTLAVPVTGPSASPPSVAAGTDPTAATR